MNTFLSLCETELELHVTHLLPLEIYPFLENIDMETLSDSSLLSLLVSVFLYLLPVPRTELAFHRCLLSEQFDAILLDRISLENKIQPGPWVPATPV